MGKINKMAENSEKIARDNWYYPGLFSAIYQPIKYSGVHWVMFDNGYYQEYKSKYKYSINEL